MKILVLGAFGPGALENFYIDGLRRQGADCETFDITHNYYSRLGKSVVHKALHKIKPSLFYHDINGQLLAFVGKKQYDVTLVFKGLTLYPATIEAMRQNTRLLCCYNPDHPFKFYSPGSGNANILQSIKRYDVYISYAKKIVEELKTIYGVHSFVLPFGYDDAITRRPPGNSPYKKDILFIGAYDAERAAWLNRVTTPGLAIYGEEKWRTRTQRFPAVRAAYTGVSLYGNDYADAISASGCTLNLLRKQNMEESSHNMRSFEVPGFGGLLVANRTAEQQEFFEEGREALYFDSPGELNDKLDYLLRHPREAALMKEAAWQRSIDSGYSYHARSRDLLAKFREYLN